MAPRQVAPAPPPPRVISKQIVKPHTGPSDAANTTKLADCDICMAWYFFGRAWGYAGCRIDAAALETALQATVTDMRFLAGRLAGAQGTHVAGMHIAHTDEGATLTVAECMDVGTDAMAPPYWAASGFKRHSPPVPFYFDAMDVFRAAQGKEALLKVRLTRMEDGDILALTINHVIADASHLPLIAVHLAARYREAVGGEKPGPADLLQQLGGRQLLSTQHMAKQLGVQGHGATAVRPAAVPPSLKAAWDFGKGLMSYTFSSLEDLIIYIPQQQVADLKQAAAEGNPVEGVTTGDAVQAASALLYNVACGNPLLPVAPAAMSAVARFPAKPPGFFGNSVVEVAVSLEQGTQQPGAGDYVGALRQLAGGIRKAMAAFRAQPERVLERLQEIEAAAQMTLLRLLYTYSFVDDRKRRCITNYLPATKLWPDLGLGRPMYDREMLTTARAGHTVIRPATAPLPDGLVIHLTLTPQQAGLLKSHPILEQLLPQARVWAAGSAP